MSIYSEVNAFLTPANWAKNVSNMEGRSCILGARAYVKYGGYLKTYDEDEFSHKVAGIVREQFPERYIVGDSVYSTYHFNDHKETTLDDIRLVLEKADADS